MSTTQTALAAVHALQKQLDLAFGRDNTSSSSPTSHHAHPLNHATLPLFLSSVSADLTASVSQLDAALNTTSPTPALSKTLAILNDYSNERYTANQQLRVSAQQLQPARYLLPRQNLQTALQMMATSLGFELFSEGDMVTLGGKMSVVDFELDHETKRSAVKVHFSYGTASAGDERMDQMLLAQAQSDHLNGLWDALGDIKRLDGMSDGQVDVFEKTREMVSSAQSLAYQISPNPTFLLHAPAEQLLDFDWTDTEHAPGSLAERLLDAQVAKLHLTLSGDGSPYALTLHPELEFGSSSGTQLMQALGKMDFPLPSSVQQGRPVFMEDLLISPEGKVQRFDPEDRFNHNLPDCPPLLFSLSTPGVERGFLLTSLSLDNTEQLQSVLPILRQQARLNALFKSAFRPECKVKKQPTSEEDLLFQPKAENITSMDEVDLNTAPQELSIEVHWSASGMSILFPLKVNNALDLHVMDIHLAGGVALDGQPHQALQQVIETGWSLPLAIRWLQQKHSLS